MKQISLIAFCVLLTACQTTGPLDENTPSHVLPSGSRLVLKQELVIPVRSAGVMLQDGRVVDAKDVNQYHPHCRLEVNDVRETTQTVTADEFLVKRAHQETQTVARPSLIKAGLRTSGTISFYVFRTVMDLRSERQPQVRSLTCQQWGDASLGEHVTIREIRKALGEIILLQLPAAPGSPQ
jgi:hypothetical protein